MAIEAVRAHFRALGLEDRIHEYEASSATVELAAEAIGCTPGEIAKTLALLQKDGPMLIITAGDARIHNRKFKDTFHEKARMIPWDDVEELVGHAPGGVCPFGIKPGVRVYLDTSLKRYETVYPAAGSIHSMVQLSVEELEQSTDFLGWVDICKDVE